MHHYANVTGKMLSSLKVGSNDSTNASELARPHFAIPSPFGELVSECISRIAITQTVVIKNTLHLQHGNILLNDFLLF